MHFCGYFKFFNGPNWEDFNVIRYLMIVNYMNDHVVVEMYNDMFLNRGVMNIRVVALLKCVTIVSKGLDG